MYLPILFNAESLIRILLWNCGSIYLRSCLAVKLKFYVETIYQKPFNILFLYIL